MLGVQAVPRRGRHVGELLCCIYQLLGLYHGQLGLETARGYFVLGPLVGGIPKLAKSNGFMFQNLRRAPSPGAFQGNSLGGPGLQ
eukprot:2402880-Pyramimonas_sp.AAC.1